MMNLSSWENMMKWGENPWMGAGFGLLALWSLVWSGLALWKSSRNNDRYWFLAFLVLNTAGILEILYLFVFAKNKLVLVSEPVKSKKSSKK